MNIAMVSLGCAKNLVDSEIMLGCLRQVGMQLVSDAREADILMINTCSFIHDAKKESMDAILRARHERKKYGLDQKIIVAGCLPQRFSRELSKKMPDVDAWIGVDQVADIVSIIRNVILRNNHYRLVSPRSSYIPDYDTPRFRLTPPHYAYVKIAEGCNHPCSFCVIPQIRGRHRSRTVKSVIQETQKLVNEGVKELLLISQDTTYFGMDRWKVKPGPRQPAVRDRGECIVDLLEALEKIKGKFWIRLLYTHPAHWSDELIAIFRKSSKVVPYVDMPIQHIHPDMLKAMRRQTTDGYIKDLIGRIRKGIPNVVLRTTMIVGFPGETEEHFESLLKFMEETRFDRLGVFQYSPEIGSLAEKMPHQVADGVKKARWKKAMLLQQKISEDRNASLIGKTVSVVTDGGIYARTTADAPEVDGRVMLARPQKAGKFMNVCIRAHDAYDLME
ncbi:MAG: 30S ribosomal protein S12 methylthiotransferase RimO [Verrucomicrobiota bacterium]